MARKTYTREFKLQALRMIADQGVSVAEAARRLGVGSRHRGTRRRGAAAAAGRERPAAGRAGPAKKGRRLLRQPAELTYRFIADHRGDCPVAWACDALGVSASGYHAWAARPPSAAGRRRGELLAAIKAVHAEVSGRYGSPRMAAELNARGHPCSENTVARLMRAHGIRAKAPRRRAYTTDSRHGLPVADNVLARDFAPAGPNAAWSAEIV